MDTSITIRTVTATQGQLYCSAGGGIAADSNEEAEYQETFDKVNRILHPLENHHVDTSRLTRRSFLSRFQLLRPQITHEMPNPTSGRRTDPCSASPPQPGCC